MMMWNEHYEFRSVQEAPRLNATMAVAMTLIALVDVSVGAAQRSLEGSSLEAYFDLAQLQEPL